MQLAWKQIVVNCFKYMFLGFMILVIIINLYLGVNKVLTSNPVPKFLGITPLIVMSGSMEPAIMPGDVVIVREQVPQKYKLGDVVTYLEGDIAFTHRIVGEEDGFFILKGDNNNAADDTVAAEELIGKVILTIPKIGFAILFFKTPLVMLVLLILLVMCIYSENLFKCIKRNSNTNHRLHS